MVDCRSETKGSHWRSLADLAFDESLRQLLVWESSERRSAKLDLIGTQGKKAAVVWNAEDCDLKKGLLGTRGRAAAGVAGQESRAFQG